MVDPEGQVVGVDMTSSMLEKTRHAADEARIENIDFRQGNGE
jgi:ubiquinone/menaquinone biosynthesis C-methylase UbiE